MAELDSDESDADVELVCQYDSTADPTQTVFETTQGLGATVPDSDSKFTSPGAIDYSNLTESQQENSFFAFPGEGTFTDANDDGWFVTTCDAVLATGAPIEAVLALMELTEAEYIAALGEESLALLEEASKFDAKFMVGFGGFDDKTDATPVTYITLPAETYSVNQLYPGDELPDDSAMSTAASLVAASAIAFALI